MIEGHLGLASAVAFSALALACNGDSFGGDAGADSGGDVTPINGGGDGGVDADATTACDPVAQIGCAADQKCTWVRDSVTPSPSGQLRCVPNGNAVSGGNCSYGASGPTTGYDNCEKGLICKAPETEGAAGTCAAICDATSANSCATNTTCVTYSDLFDDGGVATAGVCEPECDPLTQMRLTDNAPHCGGTVDGNGQPSMGCYGAPSQDARPSAFTCAPAGSIANGSDVVCDQTNSCGPYVNGCAPGYIPLLPQTTGSNSVICVALCKPGDTSSTSTTNAGGVQPYTCAAAGAGGTHECRYWWHFEGATTATSQWTDGLGVCVDYTRYEYDSNSDGTPDTPDPSCTTLSTTAHNFSSTISDAAYWGCVAK